MAYVYKAGVAVAPPPPLEKKSNILIFGLKPLHFRASSGENEESKYKNRYINSYKFEILAIKAAEKQRK